MGISETAARSATACFLLIISLGCAVALPTNVERMTVSRMKMADLETSATGYSYHQRHGAPASYVQYNDHGTGRYYEAPAPVNYVSSAPGPLAISTPIAYGAPKTILQLETVPVQYGKQNGLPPGYIVPLLPQREQPLAPYYVPATEAPKPALKIEIVEDEDEDDDEGDEEGDEEDDGDDDGDDEEEDVGPEHPEGSFGHGFDGHVESHEDAEGHRHDAEEHQARGEKGEKGYKNYHGFDKGEKGEHDSENHKGQYSEDAGSKKAHSDNAAHYDKHEVKSEGESGASYGKGASHKKGHKTSGFHNVYHKDEYKKDTDFYDEAHKSGQFEKHGAFGAEHAAGEGAFKKGGRHDSGHSESERGKSGEYDKGHNHEEAEGHRREEGNEKYHENYEDYAKKGEASEGKTHGYSRKNREEPSKYSS
ncbi:sarcoplasmic reticulum histidine-rich calcium-binding protein-like [Athalia rosae]|uniref:sarcoplasmic reticulum histidine-rich calcium-binding protein-like n=1 Tax=Athalia rosae TaxID=37344 RepID=UPI0020344386|nr:sarcoplasmic reticulum histidine-rich calcium-binding protein-like [Athalia rosae]